MRVVFVMVGGALGALARFGVGIWLAPAGTGFPLATLTVNLAGAFGLGAAGVLLTRQILWAPQLRPLVTAGFFGGLTTFSTVAVEALTLAVSDQPGLAGVYVAVTFLCGPAAAAGGMRLARAGVARGDRR